jgi:thiamine kinase-like enzyme
MFANGFGEGAKDRIFVPASLAYVPKMRMHVQARVAGTELHNLARQGEDILPLMPRTAHAIAKLHRWQVPAEVVGCLRTHSLADEVALLGRFAAELTARENIALYQQQLLDWGKALGEMDRSPSAPAPIHRDFYYSQILYHHQDTILIDFDLCAWGDPAIDLANFVMHLHLLGLDIYEDWAAFAPHATFFLQEYGYQNRMDKSFRQRLAFYMATTTFRMLHIVATRPLWARFYGEVEQQLIEQVRVGLVPTLKKRATTRVAPACIGK